jgi:hypothetical protein
VARAHAGAGGRHHLDGAHHGGRARGACRNWRSRRLCCVGVHGVFAGDALQVLRGAGVSRIVTTNTIAHETNAIRVSMQVAAAIETQLAQLTAIKSLDGVKPYDPTIDHQPGSR